MLTIVYQADGGKVKTSASDDCIHIEEQVSGNRTTVTVRAEKRLVLGNAKRQLAETFSGKDLVMANGYQSWTETKEFADGEFLNDLARRPRPIVSRFHFKQYGSQAFMPMPSGIHQGWEFSYVKGDKPFFIGSLNYKNAYLVILFDRRTGKITLESDAEGRVLEAGETFTLFDYVTAEDGAAYFERFKPVSDKKLFGYTSWYNHYQNINEELINTALDEADERFDLFQIDDGFETFVGDWLDVDPSKFPNGLTPVIERIHAKNMLAGIWLAPLVAEDSSRLMKEHPDWIAKTEAGHKIYAGSNWSGDCALDLNNQEAVAYIRHVLKHYVNLGIDFFKLDFLYACNLKPLQGKTRAETSEFACGLIREELQGKIILGCGVPLFNAAERFDFCRIGPDVSLKFDDAAYMRLFHPERVSTKVTLLNTMFRYPMDGHLFMNDPDVFLLRDDNMSMEKEQRKSLAVINGLFGSLLMTSDNIARYDREKKKILEEMLALFKRGKVLSTRRTGNEIVVVYEMDGKIRDFIYSIEDGRMR